MIAIIKKYGRWNEASNWQLESRTEKEMPQEAYSNFVEFAGFKYSKRYNEHYIVSEDKLKMTVVTVKQE